MWCNNGQWHLTDTYFEFVTTASRKPGFQHIQDTTMVYSSIIFADGDDFFLQRERQSGEESFGKW